MDIEELKLYLRVDTDDEDPLIESLQIAAEEYLLNAGVKCSYERRLYGVAVKLIVSNWYENRNPVLVGTISKEIEMSLNCIIPQLKYAIRPEV